jgi:hypothetical protein
VKPSETESGLAWLSNFGAIDVPTATVLLDGLWFAGLDTLRNSLTGALEQMEREGQAQQPTLLLPERNLGDFREEFRRNPELAIAYDNFMPGADLEVTPGSEGLIGGILRDFAKGGRNSEGPWISPDADLEEVRERRCRSVMLVTDYCGSGSQILRLAEAILRNPTIRSWRSRHYIELTVLAFAASPGAARKLAGAGSIDKVHSIESAPTIEDAPWRSEVREAVIDLCKRERRTKHYSALGYKDSGGLFATVRSAPNNLPAIFLQAPEGWHPLFPRRRVTAKVATDFAGSKPSEDLRQAADRVGQIRIGRNVRLEYMRPESRDLLQVLVSIHRRRKEVLELAMELGRPVANIEALFRALRELGFVDHTFAIKQAGWDELDAQKQALRRTTANLEGSDEVYYPRSLR